MSHKKIVFFSLMMLCSITTFYTPAYAKKKSKDATETVMQDHRITELQHMLYIIQEKICATPEFKAAKERFEMLQNDIQNLYKSMHTDQSYQDSCKAIQSIMGNSIKELLDAQEITQEEAQQLAQALVASFFPQ